MEDKKRNILFSQEQIQTRVKELGQQITKDYEGKEVYVLPLLRGSFVFGADIFKALDLKAKVGFMTTSGIMLGCQSCTVFLRIYAHTAEFTESGAS